VANISLVVGISHIGVALTGQVIPGVAEFEMPEPSYYPRFAHVLPGARFGRPAMRVVFDASALAIRLATADRAAMRMAQEECERAFAELDARLDARVRRALRAGEGIRGIEDVSAELGLSSRTLSRRLAEQGLSFQHIAMVERRSRALAMLAERHLSLDRVTERLGYSTVPSFVRAFRQWTGMTPGAYRRSRLASCDSIKPVSRSDPSD
jgi:AraC-like DNA-binding protein